MASLGSVNWGSGPVIPISFSYTSSRSGSDMVYSVKVTVSGISGGSYFGYPIYCDITCEGTPVVSETLKYASPNQWNSFSSSWTITVYNKTSGTTSIKFRIYSGSGSTRDNTYSYSMPVISGGSSGGDDSGGTESGSGSGSSSGGATNPTLIKAPNITVSTSLVNDNAVIDGWGVCVLGLSRISYNTLVSVYGAATFASGNMSIAGTTVNLGSSGTNTGSFLVNSAAGSYTTTGYVQDSNGRSGSYTGTAITVYDYKPPVIKNQSIFRCNAGGTADPHGEYIRVVATAECSSIGNRNSVTLKVRYRQSRGSWSSYSTLTSGTAKTIGGSLVNGQNYEAEIVATDTVGITQTLSFRLSGGGVTFDLKAGGAGAAFGKSSTTDGLLDVDWNFSAEGYINTNDEYRVNDIPLLDLIYPVGSIYMSVSSTFNPGTAFGGTWSKIEGKFLVGKQDDPDDESEGTFETLGSSGGAEASKFRIGVDNMPEHNHSLSYTMYEAGNHRHSFDGRQSNGSYSTPEGYATSNAYYTYYTDYAGSHTHDMTFTMGKVGKETPDEISVATIPPYFVVNMWQRVS